MGNRYKYFKLRKPKLKEEGFYTIGFVKDIKNGKIVLMAEAVMGQLARTHCTCGLSQNEGEFDNEPGYTFGIAQVDMKVYLDTMVNDRDYLEVMLMHELGHYLANHHNLLTEEYSKIRKKSEKVMPEELICDEFAIRECGIDRFLKFIDKLIAVRMTYYKEDEIIKRKAINEMMQRKEHAIEYASSLVH